MKIAFRIVLVLTLLPIVFGVSGMILANLAGCTGMDHIEHCDHPGLFPAVAFLIAFVWISVFVVPVGVVLLALLGVVRLILKKRALPGDAA